MIYEVKMYACKCDGCGKEWDNGDGVSAYTEKEHVRYSIECSEWHICVDNETYCPDCYSIDDDDEVVLKAHTLKPTPINE